MENIDASISKADRIKAELAELRVANKKREAQKRALLQRLEAVEKTSTNGPCECNSQTAWNSSAMRKAEYVRRLPELAVMIYFGYVGLLCLATKFS